MEFSTQQGQALEKAADWFKKGDEQVFRTFGYAGTGKTTIARYFAEQLKGRTQYAAYTGKASVVMRKAGCHNAQTIHSLIYETVEDPRTGEIEFVKNDGADLRDVAMIVIDECSMVDEEIGSDLLSFGKPVLVLGDPAQLPPVDGGGFFTDCEEPDVMLTEIHRQAEGNPIVHLATKVRQGNRLQEGDYGESAVVPKGAIRSSDYESFDQILVGKNATRDTKNRTMRNILGRAGQYPEEGEKVICLKNDRKLGIFNGGLFTVEKVREQFDMSNHKCHKMRIRSQDFENAPFKDVFVPNEYFALDAKGLREFEREAWRRLKQMQRFAYGYALTVHKSQGSQWDNVLLFDESSSFRDDWARWLYTGITRAAERITVGV